MPRYGARGVVPYSRPDAVEVGPSFGATPAPLADLRRSSACWPSPYLLGVTIVQSSILALKTKLRGPCGMGRRTRCKPMYWRCKSDSDPFGRGARRAKACFRQKRRSFCRSNVFLVGLSRILRPPVVDSTSVVFVLASSRVLRAPKLERLHENPDR